MHTIAEVEAFLSDVLGKGAADHFDGYMDEFLYSVRGIALADMNVTEDDMRALAKKTADNIIAESIKFHLNDKYCKANGQLDLTVGEDCIYDSSMKPLAVIGSMRKAMGQLLNAIVENVMAEFTQGRKLACVIVRRIARFENRHVRSRQEADPVEMLEVEVMRLESKLPALTKDEGVRLSELYAAIRTRSI